MTYVQVYNQMKPLLIIFFSPKQKSDFWVSITFLLCILNLCCVLLSFWLFRSLRNSNSSSFYSTASSSKVFATLVFSILSSISAFSIISLRLIFLNVGPALLWCASTVWSCVDVEPGWPFIGGVTLCSSVLSPNLIPIFSLTAFSFVIFGVKEL